MKRFLQNTGIGFAAFVIALTVFVVPVGNSKASADSGAATYDYLLGTGPLCALGPDACPDIAVAENGDKVELTGSGALSIHPKTVSGSGTFTHKNANGDVLATGTWTATQLLSFVSYGCGGTVFPDNFCGGKAQIQVHLTPSKGGPGFDGVLWVECLIGTPPAGAHEGVRLSVPGIIHFNKSVSGDTLFILE